MIAHVKSDLSNKVTKSLKALTRTTSKIPKFQREHAAAVDVYDRSKNTELSRVK